jgi:hypothetical protein
MKMEFTLLSLLKWRRFLGKEDWELIIEEDREFLREVGRKETALWDENEMLGREAD